MSRAQSGAAEFDPLESLTGLAVPGTADRFSLGAGIDPDTALYVGPLHWTVLGSGMVTQDLPEWQAYTGQTTINGSEGWLLSVVHPADRERTEQVWTLAMSTRSPYQVEHRLRGADGSYRPFLSQATPVLAPDGSIEQWHGVSTDISAVKRQTLLERWRAQTFASNHDAIIVSDVASRILDWNPAAERIYGYTRDEVLGQTTSILHRPEDRATLVARIWETLERDGQWTGEIAFVRKDGSSGVSETTVQQLLDAEGTPIGAFGVNRDISARKLGEAELEHLLSQEQATRRALENALAAARVSEQRFNKILEKNIIGMNIADAEHIIEANDAFLSMLGYTREDMLAGAISWKTLSPPEDKLADDRASQELAQKGACTPYEKTYLRKDGTRVPIILCGVLLELQPLRVASFVLDISDRKRSEAEREELLRREQAARAEEERVRAELEITFDAMTDAVIVFDRNGDIVRTNTAARALYDHAVPTGFTHRPINERTTGFLLRDEDGQPLPPEQWPGSRILQGEVLTGSSASDVRYATRDGQMVRLSASGAPIRDAHGDVVGGLTIYRDITERNRLEQRTHAALNALVDMAGALVRLPVPSGDVARDAETATADAATTARHLAELTRRVLGSRAVAMYAFEPETDLLLPLTIVGLTPEQEVSWWDARRAGMKLHTTAAASGPAEAIEQMRRLLAGEIMVIDSSQPPFDSLPNPLDVRIAVNVPMRIGDQLVGILSLQHDDQAHPYGPQERRVTSAISKLAALVIERERLLRERAAIEGRALALQEANRRMDEFLGIASHELRTPLTSIKMNLQITARVLARYLQAHPADDPALERASRLLALTDRQSTRLDRLVEDLLDVSRIQAGTLSFDPEPCDLGTVVRDVVDEVGLAWHGRTLSVELPSDRVPVLADAGRIGQVVTNLLTNALKYSAEAAPVAVRLLVDQGWARIEVRDQGSGLPAKEIPHIWERFHRAPGVQVQSGSGVGLGLGLHISKTIIERHGGTVGVESTVGAGSTFWFTLPLAAGD